MTAEREQRSYYNRQMAKRLTGQHALVRYLFLKPDGSFDHQEIKHGSIASVNREAGVKVLEDNSDSSFVLPSDLRPWRKPKRNSYITESGETISGIDMVSEWIVPHNSSIMIPYSKRFRWPRSGSYSVYGIGTNLYGHADKHLDGSYTATKWITFFFLPIFPLASYRIIRTKPATIAFGLGLRSMHQSQPVFLNVRQVIYTYLLVVPLLVLAVLAFANI